MKKARFFLLLIYLGLFISFENKEILFGIDISHYQGKIDWEEVARDSSISFIITRSTMGDDRKDKLFNQNIKKVREYGFVLGIYHYYDPNENSTKQANNFIQTAKLSPGDLAPILDIEKMPRNKDKKKFIAGIKNWLYIVEKKYKTKPMIYTYLKFYNHNLKKDIGKDYPLWIAVYSDSLQATISEDCHMIQCSNKEKIAGIKNHVDGNEIKAHKLKELLIK